MTHKHEMNCQEMLENLGGYIDGDLDGRLCSEIEAHIDSCPDCKIVVNTLKKTIQLYQVTGKEATLPKDVRKRLFARLDLEDYAQKE